MCNLSLLKWWLHQRYQQINSQNQFNIVILMQTFENLLLQNYSAEFLDTARKKIPGYVQLKFVQMVASPTLSDK